MSLRLLLKRKTSNIDFGILWFMIAISGAIISMILAVLKLVLQYEGLIRKDEDYSYFLKIGIFLVGCIVAFSLPKRNRINIKVKKVSQIVIAFLVSLLFLAAMYIFSFDSSLKSLKDYSRDVLEKEMDRDADYQVWKLGNSILDDEYFENTKHLKDLSNKVSIDLKSDTPTLNVFSPDSIKKIPQIGGDSFLLRNTELRSFPETFELSKKSEVPISENKELKSDIFAVYEEDEKQIIRIPSMNQGHLISFDVSDEKLMKSECFNVSISVFYQKNTIVKKVIPKNLSSEQIRAFSHKRIESTQVSKSEVIKDDDEAVYCIPKDENRLSLIVGIGDRIKKYRFSEKVLTVQNDTSIPYDNTKWYLSERLSGAVREVLSVDNLALEVTVKSVNPLNRQISISNMSMAEIYLSRNFANCIEGNHIGIPKEFSNRKLMRIPIGKSNFDIIKVSKGSGRCFE